MQSTFGINTWQKSRSLFFLGTDRIDDCTAFTSGNRPTWDDVRHRTSTNKFVITIRLLPIEVNARHERSSPSVPGVSITKKKCRVPDHVYESLLRLLIDAEYLPNIQSFSMLDHFYVYINKDLEFIRVHGSY